MSVREPWAPWWRLGFSLLVGALGGAGAAWLRIPLPWVLGSMAAVALLTLAGQGARQPMAFRRGAQVAIGTALGLGFTPEVVRQIGALGHWLAAGALFAVLMTMLFARVIQRLGRLDAPTSIYAVAVGASAEMALQAQRAGADAAMVASAHAVRIVLVVSLASVVARLSGEHGGVLTADAAVPLLAGPWVAALALAAPAAGWFANRARLPNGWLLGPVILAGALAANGLHGRLHPALLDAAQVLIGWSLGQHLTRRFFAESPRVLAAAAAVTLCMLGLCVMLAWSVSRWGSVSLLTAFLSLAPGGTAEMAIVAKNFGIGAPIVTTFHFFRVITMIVLMKHVAALLLRSGWVRTAAP